MAKIQYTGLSHFREITAADWKSVGVEDQNKTVWERDAETVLDVSDAAAEYLLKKEPKGDFKVIEDDEPEEVAPIENNPPADIPSGAAETTGPTTRSGRPRSTP